VQSGKRLGGLDGKTDVVVIVPVVEVATVLLDVT
jgi:hypothetical protein